MNIIEGHLTATDKKAIKAILSSGLTSGRVGKKDYFLTVTDGIYTVKQIVKDRGLIPVPGSEFRLSTYTSKFILPNQKQTEGGQTLQK
jgi:hypothetical protein